MMNHMMVPTPEGNILDLVLSNNGYLISMGKVDYNAKLSDHDLITVYLTLRHNKIKEVKEEIANLYRYKVPEYNLKGGDFENWLQFRLLLDGCERDWDQAVKDLDIAGNINHLHHIIKSAMSKVFV